MLLKGRIAWPELFTPKAFEEGGEKKYQCSILIPKDDPQAKVVMETVAGLIKSDLGGKAPDDRYMPVKDGDKSGNADYAGHIEIRCKNTRKPGVVDQNLETIIDPELIRSGDYVNVDVGIFAYNRKFKGIGVSLNNVQYVQKGDPIGGSAKRPEDAFTKIEVASGSDALSSFLGG